MPLTLQLFGSDPHKVGQLIIDRKNLITVYPYWDLKEQQQAADNRNRMSNLLYSQPGLDDLLSDEESFAMTEDPRHDVLEHMSSYDRRHSCHQHFIFKTDVTLNHIKFIFSNLSLTGFKDLISEECRNLILSISENYFHDLETNKEAQKIEAEYREEKDNEFAEATKLAERAANPPGQQNLPNQFPSGFIASVVFLNTTGQANLSFGMLMQLMALQMQARPSNNIFPLFPSSQPTPFISNRIEELDEPKKMVNESSSGLDESYYSVSDRKSEDEVKQNEKIYQSKVFFFADTAAQPGMEESRKAATQLTMDAMRRAFK